MRVETEKTSWGFLKVKNKKSTFQRGKKNETCHQFSSPYKLQKSQSKKIELDGS